MKRPAISIIVPVYNLEFYVERTLASLQAQTVEDLEFVIVDDGSTDDTSAIVAEFAARDPRFRVFRKQNGGHGSACNLGIEHARGEYVLFCDGDDWLSPDTCRRMLELARGYDVDLLLGNLTYFHANQTRSSFTPLRSGGERLLNARDRSLLFTNFATPCGRMYRREIFDDPAIRFLPRILFADVSFAPKTYYAARRIAYVDESFYNYDLTRPTQSMQQRDERLLNVIPAMRDVLDFFRQKQAFAAWERDLIAYVMMHVFSWLEKVRPFPEPLRTQAVKDLFGVLDGYFDDRWVGDVLNEYVGRSRARLLRQARRVGYGPVVWTWDVRDQLTRLDDGVEKLLRVPLGGYARGKQFARRTLGRLAP